MDASKANLELGWRAERTFESALAETVRWYQTNAEWVASVLDGRYRDYYQKQYGSP
jgi:dTDP-glucose 4,6-dehydratase